MGQDDAGRDRKFWEGLRELAASAFPKRCGSCGREYRDAAEYAAATRSIAPTRVGFVPSEDDDGRPVLELYRNCQCGSTLLAFFADRRDVSPAGLARRQRFGMLLDDLVARDLGRDVARRELLKVMHGEASEVLEALLGQDLGDLEPG